MEDRELDLFSDFLGELGFGVRDDFLLLENSRDFFSKEKWGFLLILMEKKKNLKSNFQNFRAKIFSKREGICFYREEFCLNFAHIDMLQRLKTPKICRELVESFWRN